MCLVDSSAVGSKRHWFQPLKTTPMVFGSKHVYMLRISSATKQIKTIIFGKFMSKECIVLHVGLLFSSGSSWTINLARKGKVSDELGKEKRSEHMRAPEDESEEAE